MSWSCLSCTFENPVDRDVCAICNDINPSALEKAIFAVPPTPPELPPRVAGPGPDADPRAALRGSSSAQAVAKQRRAFMSASLAPSAALFGLAAAAPQASSCAPASAATSRSAMRATVAEFGVGVTRSALPKVPIGDRLRRSTEALASAHLRRPSPRRLSSIAPASASAAAPLASPVMPASTLVKDQMGSPKPLLLDLSLIGGASGFEGVLGGKAGSLARMMELSHAGAQDASDGHGAAFDRAAHEDVAVPAAAAVTTHAYLAHVAGFQKELETLLTEQKEEITEEQLVAIRAKIVDRPLDAPLVALIEAFLAGVAAECPSLAVRSSSTQEDEAGASWAGQYETFLNVPKALDQVALAVKRCWASIWELRSISYRRRLERQSATRRPLPAMAVVIQRQLNPRAAGVLFTLDPVTGSEDHFVIESVWGLGEGVVGGEISPHTFTLSWVDGSVQKQHHSPQLLKYAFLSHSPPSSSTSGVNAGAGGGHFVGLVPTTAEERAQPSLSTAELQALVRIGTTVAAVAGHPQDIEWAIENGTVFLLQTRNITAFTVSPPVALTHLGFFDAGLFTLSKCSGAYSELLKRETQGLLPLPDCPLLFQHFARVYIVQQYWWDYFRVKEAAMKGVSLHALLDKHVPAFEAIKVRSVAFAPLYQRIFSSGCAPLSDRELSSAFTDLNIFQQDIDCLSYTVGELVEHCENKVKEYLNWLNEAAPDSEPLRLARLALGVNSDSDPKKSSEYLSAGARSLVSDPEVRAHYCGASSPSPAGPHPLVVEWVLRYVDRFFYMSSADEDISAVRFKEDPSTPLAILESLLRAESLKPAAQQPAQFPAIPSITFFQPEPVVLDDQEEGFSDEFGLLLQRLEETGRAQGLSDQELHFHQDNVSEYLVDGLRKFLWWKETIHTLYVWSGYFNRRMICEMALRAGFATPFGPYWNGATITEQHPLWALPAEVLRGFFVPTADLSSIHTPDNLQLLRKHVTKRAFFSKFDPPSTLKPGRKCSAKTESPSSATSPDGEGALLSGVGASAGQVTGRARVILSLREAGEVQKGEILVTRYTDPSWTPLFSLISAVIIEDGGALSHAAVVARELGICAITQAKGATKLIKTGDVLVLDGSTGSIQRLN
ncbi:MAG: PEP/pyruvate-binding domain-containing protein [archaeon]|nr:PEP/pyruvate-binding domain-containing protein [archaeon]